MIWTQVTDSISYDAKRVTILGIMFKKSLISGILKSQ